MPSLLSSCFPTDGAGSRAECVSFCSLSQAVQTAEPIQGRNACPSSSSSRRSGVEPHQHVKVVIHNRKPTHRDREDSSKLLEPIFDPLLTVKPTFTQQKCTTHTAGNAVIPACESWIVKLGTRDRHGCLLLEDTPSLPNRQTQFKNAMHVFLCPLPGHRPCCYHRWPYYWRGTVRSARRY